MMYHSVDVQVQLRACRKCSSFVFYDYSRNRRTRLVSLMPNYHNLSHLSIIILYALNLYNTGNFTSSSFTFRS